MLSKVSLMDLTGIAGLIGLVGAGVSMILVNKTRDKVFKEEYCVKALEILHQNKSAMDLIGPPLKKYRIDLSDNKNNCFEPLTARIKMPFKGTKRRGDLFVWADRQHSHHNWTLRRLEIIFDDIRDQKVIVYKNESKE